jgi:hypothetical protein
MSSKGLIVMRGSVLAGLAAAALPSQAVGQITLKSFAIVAGGSTTPAVGGQFGLRSTLGQPAAGVLAGGQFRVAGGFLPAAAGGPAACYANCDGSTAAPVLNVNDFQCFLNKYAQGDAYANCDGSTTPPILNVNDFQCFLNRYAQGCP